MGTTMSIKKIGFEEMQDNIACNSLIINTLSVNEQGCLINNTINCSREESIINSYLKENKMIKIVIWGRNCLDQTVYDKYKQLNDLGFKNIVIYLGGLFEWLLLQEIYGDDFFKTTNKELNILQYKPCKLLKHN